MELDVELEAWEVELEAELGAWQVELEVELEAGEVELEVELEPWELDLEVELEPWEDGRHIVPFIEFILELLVFERVFDLLGLPLFNELF